MSDQDDFDGPAITRGPSASQLKAQQDQEAQYSRKTESRLGTFFSILFWVAMGVALMWAYGVATEKKASKLTSASSSLAQRKQASRDAIKAGPTSESWETIHGTVIALDIPKPTAGGLLVESQRCIVWRDAVTSTASMQCDKSEIDLKNYPIDPPDIE
jgi:hypothetical protein